MSYADAYQSPQPLPPKPGERMFQYQEMFAYVFQNPNWMMNLLWGAICILVTSVIPIVPYMVLFGYQFELVEALHKRRGRTYPDFDTNRIGDYLGRGVWPMLAAMVVGLVLAIVMVPLMFIGMGIVMALLANDQPILGVLAGIVFWVAFMALMVFLNVLMLPMMLRAGLTQQFGEAFNFGWVRSFAGLVWKELILGGLFLMLGNFVATIVGMALLCIGIYPAMALVMMAQAHFMWQLYEIFLERGGEPIPLKQPAPAPIPVSR